MKMPVFIADLEREQNVCLDKAVKESKKIKCKGDSPQCELHIWDGKIKQIQKCNYLVDDKV